MTMAGSSVPVHIASNSGRQETALHFFHTRSWKDDVLKSTVDSAFRNAAHISCKLLRQLAPNTGANINKVRSRLVLFFVRSQSST